VAGVEAAGAELARERNVGNQGIMGHQPFLSPGQLYDHKSQRNSSISTLGSLMEYRGAHKNSISCLTCGSLVEAVRLVWRSPESYRHPHHLPAQLSNPLEASSSRAEGGTEPPGGSASAGEGELREGGLTPPLESQNKSTKPPLAPQARCQNLQRLQSSWCEKKNREGQSWAAWDRQGGSRAQA
jgi:hypothetical protein